MSIKHTKSMKWGFFALFLCLALVSVQAPAWAAEPLQQLQVLDKGKWAPERIRLCKI